MDPVIRNKRDNFDGTSAARLINLDDNPPTCTLTYSEIPPGETSAHHIHEWEHEVYIIEGSGTLVCDGVSYPVKAGDALFIPPNVDHYTLNNGNDGNNGPQGNIHRIEINPLIAAQSGGAKNDGGKGTGQPPVIRNHTELDRKAGHVLITSDDGAPNYVMLHNDPMQPGAVSHPDTGGHIHEWEHVVYVLEGTATLVCGGKDYTVSAGDAILVPPNEHHQWKNVSQAPVIRVTYNPVASEAAEH
jgi:quercetin dioxygenase-like cupin family protein|tara:strand:+ start:2096 stop:2827 length:732 start_codon:yes stop_codon:yes gene_type:complete